MSRSVNTLSRQQESLVPQTAEAGVWWAEVADLRERIERRRADERRAAEWSEERVAAAGGAPRRTITITGHTAQAPAAVPLRLVERTAADAAAVARLEADELPEWPVRAAAARQRPRRTPAEWLSAKPDRVAAWAAALGFLLVLAGILSAH